MSIKKAITKMQAAVIAVIIIVAIIAGIAYYSLMGPAATPTPTTPTPKTPTPTTPTPATPTPPTPTPATPTPTTPTPATPTPATPTPGPPLKIGLVLPMTGPSARLGQHGADSVMMAVEEINAAGGILGRPIQIILEDDEGNPDKFITVVKKLVEVDRVYLLMGPLHTGNLIAGSEYIASVGIPLITPFSYGPILLYQQNPGKYRNFFSLWMGAEDGGRGLLTFLRDVVKAKTFVCISESLTFSVKSGEYLKLISGEIGINCLDQIVVPPGCKDFSDVILKIKELNPDAVVTTIFTGAEVTLVKEYHEQRVSKPICGLTALFAEWDLVDLLGEHSDYTCFVAPMWNVSITEKTVRYYTKFYEKYGYKLGGSATAYDGVYFIKAALERAVSLETEAIIKACEEVEVIGAAGRLKIDPRTHGLIYGRGYVDWIVGQWIGGKPYVIHPPNLAEAEFKKAPWWS